MNIRRVAALVALPLIFGLTACEGDSATNAAETSSDARSYRGFEVKCFKDGYGKRSTGTCDFGAFYAEHPELLADKSLGDEEGVKWLKVEGKPLACVKVGHGERAYLGCDWIRYDNANRTPR